MEVLLRVRQKQFNLARGCSMVIHIILYPSQFDLSFAGKLKWKSGGVLGELSMRILRLYFCSQEDHSVYYFSYNKGT